MNPQHAEALRLADDLDAMGRSKDMGRPAIQDIERRAAAMLRSLAAPHATAEQRAVPAGWQLVPVEPTPEMAAAYDTACFSDYWREEGYAAMLAASPAAPAPCGMVGLTHEEAVDVLRFGASSKAMADAITRAFCQKNKLTFEDQSNG